MKYCIVAALMSLCIILPLSADSVWEKPTDAHVYGHVIDKRTKEHLSYINVFVKGTTIGAATDVSGHYFLENLPVGSYVIEAKSIGYRPVQKNISIKEKTTLEVNFELEEDNISLDEVVISANRNETAKQLAPTLVNVLDAKLFETTHASCLVQGLSFQPGVRVEDGCQNCGLTQARINGLDGHYSQILIDSHPVFSALNGVYGLEQIPSNMIDRVEIVRGGGSALFGSSAVGGTINIITKESVKNSGELGHSITSIGGGNTFDNVTMLNASIMTGDSKAGLYIYGQNRNREGYDHDKDGYTELPQLRIQTLGVSSFLKTGLYSKLTLQYHGMNDFRRGGNLLKLPPPQANIAEQAEHNINGGALSFDWATPDLRNRFNVFTSFQNTQRKSYYGGKGDGSAESIAVAEKAYGTTHDLTFVSGIQFIHNFKKLLFMPSDLTLGVEYNYDGLKDKSVGYNFFLNQSVNIGSGYFQNEWKNDKWSLLLGGRLDKHSFINHIIFSPRINLRFNPVRNMSLRLSYAGGFRAPQTYDEDLHVSMVGGNRVKTRLADGLKEERSNSLSASADFYHNFGSISTNLLIEGFYTGLKNVFAERYLPLPDGEGNTILERYNGSGARVMGINLEGRASLVSWFMLEVGATLQQSKYKESEKWSEEAVSEKKMFRTPNIYGYFTANFDPVKKLTMSFSGTYTGNMLVQHSEGSGTNIDVAVETPKFFDMGIKFAYDIFLYKVVTLQLSAGVHNLFNAYQSDFDKGYERDSKYIYGPSLPRSYFMGAKVSF